MAVGRVPEARREAGDGRLARAGGADERDGLAGRDVEVEMREDDALAVAELDAVEARPRRVRPAAARVTRARARSAASSSTPESFSRAAAAAWNRL